MQVLVLNSGSSSLKFGIVKPKENLQILEGQIEGLGSNHPTRLSIQTHSDHPQNLDREISAQDHQSAMEEMFASIEDLLENEISIDCVGHRVVHGGEKFFKASVIDKEVIRGIEACVNLAPLHNPANLKGIEIAMKKFKKCTHVAVFDTAFHQSIPETAYIYPLPRKLYEECGVRKYGFHGSSHQYVAREAARILELPMHNSSLITAHLGNGCSAAAILNGKSVDTTMGLTPLEGLVMGTRSGDVDPGLHEYLHNTLGWEIEEIHNMLNKESGLLGLSGLSSDMRTITTAAKQGHRGATLAADVFAYHLAQAIAGLSVNFRRLDALVFTGGIGEHSATIRSKTLRQLRILGFDLDRLRNRIDGKESQGIITVKGVDPVAIVVPTNEQMQIAWECSDLLKSE